MRKITLALTVALLSLSPLSHAQEIMMGQTKKFNIKYSEFDIVGKVNNKNVVYRAYDNELILDVYNDSMKLMHSVPVNFINKKTEQVFMVNMNDRIACLYVVEDRGSKTLYGAIIKENGQIVQASKKLLEEKKSWFALDNESFEFTFSNDKSTIAVMTHGGKQKDQFKYLVFDDQFNIQWKGETKISGEELGDYIAYNYMKVSNSGHIFFPTFSNNNSGTLFDTHILTINANNPNEYKRIGIGGDKTYFNDLILRINDIDNYCQVSGTYKSNKNGKVEGLYTTKISFNSSSSSQTNLTEFDENFLKKVKSKNYKKAFNDYRIQEIIFRKDGGCIIIAEEQNFEIKNVYNGGYMGFNNIHMDPMYSTTNREYTYGNITMVNLDKDGNILWAEHIRKTQKSIDDKGEFSSYTLLNTGQNLVFVYNLFNNSDQSIGLYSVDPTGQLQVSRLNTLQRHDEWLMKRGTQIAPMQVMVPIIGTGELNFAIVDFSK